MMKWGHLPKQAAGQAELSDGAVGRDAHLVLMEV